MCRHGADYVGTSTPERVLLLTGPPLTWSAAAAEGTHTADPVRLVPPEVEFPVAATLAVIVSFGVGALLVRIPGVSRIV